MASDGERSEFAGALRGWRRRRRVSQLELALRAGTSQRHVSFIEGDLVSSNDAFWLLADGVAAELLVAPVSVPRLLVHPQGMAPRIVNLDEWGWHVVDALRHETARNPDDRLEALVTELEQLVPPRPRQSRPEHLGFAVPMRLRSSDGELRLLTTLTHFGTAVDVTVAELRLEAFLPADEASASILTELGRTTPRRR